MNKAVAMRPRMLTSIVISKNKHFYRANADEMRGEGVLHEFGLYVLAYYIFYVMPRRNSRTASSSSFSPHIAANA